MTAFRIHKKKRQNRQIDRLARVHHLYSSDDFIKLYDVWHGNSVEVRGEGIIRGLIRSAISKLKRCVGSYPFKASGIGELTLRSEIATRIAMAVGCVLQGNAYGEIMQISP